MNILKALRLTAGLAVTSLLLVPASAAAATAAACTKEYGGFLGFPTWYKYLKPRFEGGECVLNVVFPGSIVFILLAVAEILMRVSALVAIGFVIYGGFQYIFSQGEPDKTKTAKATITNALIGLVIAMLAVAVVNLVARNLIT